MAGFNHRGVANAEGVLVEGIADPSSNQSGNLNLPSRYCVIKESRAVTQPMLRIHSFALLFHNLLANH